MKIKINGTTYEVTKRTTKDLDAYYKKGIFVDTVKHDKAYKYEADVDGQIIGICKKYQYVLKVISIVVLIICCIVVAHCAFNMWKRSDKAPEESAIDTGEEEVKNENSMPIIEDPVLLRYNKFCVYTNGNIDLRFINGDFNAKISVYGENIECEPLEVSAGEEVLYVPIKVDTNNELLNAELVYTYNKGTMRYPIVIENIMDVQEVDENITLQDEEVIYE